MLTVHSGRDLNTILNMSHMSQDGFNLDTPDSILFKADKFHGCVLNPEFTDGPFCEFGSDACLVLDSRP